MYKRPLIISDNSLICDRFLKISNELLPEISFDIAISPFTEMKLFSEDVKIFNLKNERDVNFIINEYDLIFSIHCKQIFPKALVSNRKCINIHPGYNPINRGWYPQVFAIIHNLEIGATIHEINMDLDNGPIIGREKIEKYQWDTSLTLYNRLVEMEMLLLRKYLKKIIQNTYEIVPSNEPSNLYLKKDFNDLKKIDLKTVATYGEVIDHLRALTYDNYKNAYFETEEGEIVYISLNLHKNNVPNL